MKKNIIAYFLLSTLFFIISIAFHFENEKKIDEKRIMFEIQQKFLEKERQLNSYLEKLSQIDVQRCTDLLDFVESENIDNREFVFYFYHDSLLKAWSSNHVNLPTIFTETNLLPELSFNQNIWVYETGFHKDSIHIIGFLLIKEAYNPEQKNILTTFFPEFLLGQNISISSMKDTYNIFNNDGEFVFSVLPLNELRLSDKDAFTEVILWLIAITFLIIGLAVYLPSLSFFSKNRNRIWLTLTMLIFLILTLFETLQKHEHLLTSELFSPKYFSSVLLSSLGELFVIAYLSLLMCLIMRYSFSVNVERIKKDSCKIFVGYLLFFFAFLSYVFTLLLLHQIIGHSTTIIKPALLYKYNLMSVITVVSISAIITGFPVFSRKMIAESYKLFPSQRSFLKHFILFSIICIILAYVIYSCLFQFKLLLVGYMIVFIFYMAVLVFHVIFPKKILPMIFRVISWTLFALLSSFVTKEIKEKKDIKNTEMLANAILTTENPVVFYDLNAMIEAIENDNVIAFLISKRDYSSDSIQTYIEQHYFEKYTNLYQYQIALDFSPKKETELRKMEEKFERSEIINPENKNIRSLRRDFGEFDFLIKIEIPVGKDTCLMFTQFRNKFLQNASYVANQRSYYAEMVSAPISFGEYNKDGILISEKEDIIPHKIHLADYNLDTIYNGMRFSTKDFEYILYQTDSRTLIITRYPESNFILITEASFIFLMFAAFGSLSWLIYYAIDKAHIHLSFLGRIQRMVTWILLFSFFFAGILFIKFSIENNTRNQIKTSTQQINYIESALRPSLDTFEVFDEKALDITLSILSLSPQNFLFNIGIYNMDGENILKSKKILDNYLPLRGNPEISRFIKEDNSSILRTKENINGTQCFTVYKPLINQDGDIIAFIGFLSLFDQLRELHYLNSFLSMFLSLYFLFIIIALFVGSLITRYITSSLATISNHMTNVRLKSGENKKLEWKNKDEIGMLVDEYNNLIDQLDISIELLRCSEREFAWKEMAKQIAHEIKNPLTPMRLSSQQIQREISNNQINREKLTKFTNMLVEQIDTLNEITSSFSSFAKNHHDRGEKENLINIINNVLPLYAETDGCVVRFENHTDSDSAFCFISKASMTRVLNNLIKNAIQAKKENEIQNITISLSELNDRIWQIEIEDTGVGMSKETQEKAFDIHFTTKSTGSGLGLIIVKNIISDWGGTISFESEKGEGTLFIINLPRCKNEECGE